MKNEKYIVGFKNYNATIQADFLEKIEKELRFYRNKKIIASFNDYDFFILEEEKDESL